MSSNLSDPEEEPLDTSMEAHDGKPEAVVKLFQACTDLISDFPEEMRLSVEIELWEVGAREDDQ